MIVLYILAAILILFFGLAAILPKHYNIEKSIVINKPAQVVYNQIADLNNYKNWNPWQQMEPDNKSTITGTPGTPGHRFAWEGKKIGSGHLTIKSAIQSKSVSLDLVFIKPFASKANDNWKFEERNGSTTVTWQNDGGLPYPMGRLMGAAIKKNLNHQFVQGLNNLKESCEK